MVVDEDRSVAWVGHFECDDSGVQLSDIAKVRPRNRSLLVLRSGRGFHLLALELGNWSQKVEWFEHWQSRFPSDFVLSRDNVLRITEKNGSVSTFEKFYRADSHRRGHCSGFHVRAFSPRVPQSVVEYYRDRQVSTTGLYKSYYSDPAAVFESARGR